MDLNLEGQTISRNNESDVEWAKRRLAVAQRDADETQERLFKKYGNQRQTHKPHSRAARRRRAPAPQEREASK